MSRVGRNDPCPCGSGKKYKRCCLGKDDAGPATPISDVDGAVTRAVLHWVASEHRARVEHAQTLLAPAIWESEEASTLCAHLLAWETPAADGGPLCLRAPPRLRRSLDPREQDWFDEQLESWFSLWDVLEVRRDEGLFLRDLFTGAERFVRERLATHYAVERSVMLARIVRLGDVWTLAASHPRQLPAHAGDAVAADARKRLKLGRGKVDPSRLRGEAAWRLVALWDDAVDTLVRAPRPQLRNTEGDELIPTEDHFSFAAADRDLVLARLRAIPELEEFDEDEEEPESHVFIRVQDPGRDEFPVHLARLEVGDVFLGTESNSTRRADDTRALLEAHLQGLLQFVDRVESDPWDAVDDDDLEDDDLDEDGEDALPPEEAARLILGFKEQHYATWPDIPLPALGGLTPRDAARDKRRKVYRQLDVVLRDIERGESMQPFEQRYDVGILRRELGL